MKKVIYLSALVATMLLAACSSEEELVPQPQLGEPVKAQFTISIPQATGSSTRATDAIVQSAQTIAAFRGIENIYLYAFADADVTASSNTDGIIGLVQMLKPQQVGVNNYIPSAQLLRDSKAVLFGDVLIPSGTQNFLFYGKAIDETQGVAITDVADKFTYGTLNPVGLGGSTATTPAAFSFEPVPITTAANSNSKRSAIITYLNSIKNATDGTTAWAGSNYNTGLETLYTKFTSMTAGSSADLQAAVEDLYNAVKDNAHSVAQDIKAKIAAGDVTISTNSTTNVSTVTFGSTLSGYPSTDDNLPDGAARLTFSSGTFAYAEINTSSASAQNVPYIANYVYPPNLYYRVESKVKVSKTSQASHYDDDMTWDNVGSKGIFTYYTDGEQVDADSRSVILVSPVQFAVGRLDVRLISNYDSELADYNNTAIDFTGDNIKMTGILIGGQKPVDWEFKPLADDPSATPAVTIPEYTIYEDFTKSGVGPKSIIHGSFYNGTDKLTINSGSDATLMTRTLVLETAGDDNEKVNVALEFLNNTGADFVGKNGQIIPKGCKFYLVGALDMSKIPTATIAAKGNKVFQQDVVTLANFSINDLKQAENTIPDLRNPAIELGLSVDLEWLEGITFTHTFGDTTP